MKAHNETGQRVRAHTRPPDDDNIVIIRIPIRFQTRVGRKRMLAPDGTQAFAPLRPQVDNALIKAIARAHRWRRMLESGECASTADLAKAEKINQSYLCRVLRMTLLAPEIVEIIVNGTCSPELTLERAMSPFPVEWKEQRGALC